MEKKSSRSILKNLILSYGAIIIIYIAAGTFLQVRAVSVVKKQSGTIYENMLNVLSKVVDNEVKNIQTVAVDIAIDPVVTSFIPMGVFNRQEHIFLIMALGVDMMLHFQFRTFPFGAEQLNYAIVDADGVPRRRYREMQKS